MSKSRPLPFYDEKAAHIAAMKPGEIIQTRRPIKNQKRWWKFIGPHPNGGWQAADTPLDKLPVFDKGFDCPHGVPGDTIWVRETWQIVDCIYDYYAGGYELGYPFDKIPQNEPKGGFAVLFRADEDDEGPWRPSIHMPRWASRSLLTIVEVRAERVQEISPEDVIQEGVKYDSAWGHFHTNPDSSDPWGEFCDHEDKIIIRAFHAVWDGFYKDTPYAWERNPFVWVLTLRKE
jgi:hypothetical protein